MQPSSTENSNNKQLIPLSYKIVTLTFIMGNWLLCFAVMSLDFELYKQITLGALIYILCVATFYNIGKLAYASYQTLSIIDDDKKRCCSKLDRIEKIQHTNTFVVPNYKENIDVIRKTLRTLADHQFSETYLVVLAMEEGEKEAALKAVELINEFKNSFKGLEYTLHIASPGEAQGKSANVNWCTMRLEPLFQKYQIDANKVLITVIDADSIIPEIYIGQLERKCLSDCSNYHDFIFCSPHTYSMNRKDSMILGRAYDTLYSHLHYATLQSFFKVSFPISNYTISFNTLKQINFNDVHQDCIAQDCHLTLKAISETKGRVSVVPIYTFSNQMNLVGGGSFMEEFKSKFWQEERHQRGVLQIAYAFKQMVDTKFRNKRIIYAFLTVFQVYLDQIGGLWYTTYVIHQVIFQFVMGSYIDPSRVSQIIGLMSLLISLAFLIGILITLYARFSFETYFFKINTFKDRLIEFVEFLVLFPVASIIYAQTAGIFAVVSLFNKNSKYITTEKKISKQ